MYISPAHVCTLHMQRSVAAIEKVLKNRCQSSMVSGFDYFQLGTSSMNSNARFFFVFFFLR